MYGTLPGAVLPVAGRIIDYRSNRVLLHQQLIGAPTCIALHPQGVMLAVGSSEQLSLYYILA